MKRIRKVPAFVTGRRRKRDNPEQRLQMQVAEFFGYALRPPTLWTAFPAGGGGWMRGQFLKAMGLKRGWSDFLIIARGREFSTGRPGLLLIGIELKSEDGEQSAPQKLFESMLEAVGGYYFVARSVGEVEGYLRGVGIQLNARVAA